MTRKEKAVDYYSKSFNCAQAVFTAYRDENLIDELTALKLSTVFGGGIAATGSGTCGAVLGALMAISLKYGRDTVENLDAKAKTYELSRNLMNRFEQIQGSCICDVILGVNIGTNDNMKIAADKNFFKTKCTDAVRCAADLLEELL